MISRMEEEQRLGPLERILMVTIRTASNMEMGNSGGQIIVRIQVAFTLAIFKAMENINGVTGEPTKVCGILTKCTAKEHKNGQMARLIKENTYTTKKKVMVDSCGLTPKPTKASGKTTVKTVRDIT